MAIDWSEVLDGDFIRFEQNDQKRMVLTGWKMVEAFEKQAVEFKVTELNDKPCEKTWTVSAKSALKLLKPIIEKAESENRTEVKVSVIAVGDGTGRKYSITESK